MNAEHAINQIYAFLRAGQPDLAEQAAAPLVAAGVRDGRLWLALAGVHVMRGRPDQAADAARRALAAKPTPAPDVLIEAARALSFLGAPGDAAARLGAEVKALPQHLRLRLAYAEMLHAAKRYAAALEQARRAQTLDPRSPDAALAVGGMSTLIGRAQEALDAFRKGLALSPNSRLLASALCLAINAADATPAEVLDAHRRAAATLPPPAPRPAPRDPNPDRPLRVGFVTADAYNHSVSTFLAPLLASLSPSQLSATIYSTNRHPTDPALRPRVDRWREAAEFTEDALAAAVVADEIDVLVDLAGHTHGHRLGVFQRRPAPVQITYLGYAATTGLEVFDARLVDSLTDPPGAEAHASEPLVRLDPCFLALDPASLGPPPVAARAPGDPVVFGSFNALPKLTERTVRAWAELLRRVPGSRLLLKNASLGEPQTQADLRGRFKAAGLDPARVELLAWTPTQDAHRALYARVDVALDTFPYNGTTTTVEALAMGVPVVALAGDRHAARVGVSLLTAVGLPEFVAPTIEAYLDTAERLAADPARLAQFRTALPGRLAASPLGDPAGLARRFEAAVRDLWRARCAAP